MSRTKEIWPEELLQVLRVVTRKHQFDFNRISEDLRQYTSTNPSLSHLVCEISPSSCRNAFAQDFENFSPSITDSIGERQLDNTMMPVSRIPDVSDLSFEETMALVSKLEQENEQKKFAVFQRVLESMSGASALEEHSDSDFSFLKSVFEESKKKREDAQLERERKHNELQEQRQLHEQREILRRRFEIDSDDAVGFAPTEVERKPDFPDEDDIESESGIRYASFDIEAMLATAEFDRLLAEVEEDLMYEEPHESSELSEVLAFLDQASISRAPAKKGSTSRPLYAPAQVRYSDRPIIGGGGTSSAPSSPTSLKVGGGGISSGSNEGASYSSQTKLPSWLPFASTVNDDVVSETSREGRDESSCTALGEVLHDPPPPPPPSTVMDSVKTVKSIPSSSASDSAAATVKSKASALPQQQHGKEAKGGSHAVGARDMVESGPALGGGGGGGGGGGIASNRVGEGPGPGPVGGRSRGRMGYSSATPSAESDPDSDDEEEDWRDVRRRQKQSVAGTTAVGGELARDGSSKVSYWRGGSVSGSGRGTQDSHDTHDSHHGSNVDHGTDGSISGVGSGVIALGDSSEWDEGSVRVVSSTTFALPGVDNEAGHAVSLPWSTVGVSSSESESHGSIPAPALSQLAVESSTAASTASSTSITTAAVEVSGSLLLSGSLGRRGRRSGGMDLMGSSAVGDGAVYVEGSLSTSGRRKQRGGLLG